MEFLGVGYQELIVVLVLMLIFVGPERMPVVAYQVGRAVRTMQKYARAVRDEFSDEIAYVEEQVKTVRGEVDATRTAIRDEQQKFNAELAEIAPATLPPLLEAAPEPSAVPAASPPESVTESAPERPSGPPLVF